MQPSSGFPKIDVHAHALHPELLEDLAANSTGLMPVHRTANGFRVDGYGDLDQLLFDLPGRLASLRARSVVMQLVAPPPPMWARPNWAAGISDARRMNASTRRCVRESDGLLGGLVVPALGEPAGVVMELERELRDGGFRGIALPSCAGSRPLDHPDFDDLFRFLHETRLPAFMHSVSSGLGAGLRQYTLNTVLAWPCETAVAVARLIFSGVLERTPFNLVLSHGGGVLPFLAGRLDLAFHAPRYEHNAECHRNIARPPSTYLKALYYDTVVASPDSLRFLFDWAGTEHVVFGSDFPYEIGDAEGKLAAPAIAQLPRDMQALVYGGNMARLLDQPNL